MSDETSQPLDGNAAAGPLQDVFAVDITTASGRCAGCGSSMIFAQTRVYSRAPGLVVRCPGCDAVLMRLVQSPDRTWVDLRGLDYLEIVAPTGRRTS